MGHAVSTFIAAEPVITKLSATLGNAPFHRSGAGGLCFLPVTDETFDLATGLKGDSDPLREGYYRFSKSLAAVASDCSADGPIAHVFTDYFGGDGTQGATVWTGGKQVMAPEVSRQGAINSALRRIGLKAKPPLDEFDTIGLGDYRSNDDFVAPEAEPPTAPPAGPTSILQRLYKLIFG